MLVFTVTLKTVVSKVHKHDPVVSFEETRRLRLNLATSVKTVFSVRVIVAIACFNIWKMKSAKNIASFVTAVIEMLHDPDPG